MIGNIDFTVDIPYLCIMDDKKPKPKFDRASFKEAIAMIESEGGKKLDNANSSAAGRYHFLYRYIRDTPILKGISKREFINRPDLQEKIMDMAIDGTLPGFPSYEKKSHRLKAQYNTNLRQDEIAALTHFLGTKGVEDYLKNPMEFNVPGNNNATVKQYVDRFNIAQGTEASYKTDLKQNIRKASDFAPVPFDNSLEGSAPALNGHFVEGDPTQEIYSLKNESFDDEAYTKTLLNETPKLETKEDRVAFADPVDNESIMQQGQRLSTFVEQEDFALGGELGGSGVEELTEFKGGGTHEENPLGGIPQGIGENGKLNTVEENETKWGFDDGDYVFSNRIIL